MSISFYSDPIRRQEYAHFSVVESYFAPEVFRCLALLSIEYSVYSLISLTLFIDFIDFIDLIYFIALYSALYVDIQKVQIL